MTDDLVKRLRADNDKSFVETLCGEAADRIEALTDWREQDGKLIAVLGEAMEIVKADNERLREVVLEADKLLCGDLAGLQWKRECRSFLVLARAVLKGETRD